MSLLKTGVSSKAHPIGKWLLVGFAAAGCLAGLLLLALKPAGEASTITAVQATLARVSALWPSLQKLPPKDRYAVVTAAATCGVYRLPPEVSREQVIACLRDGAREHDQQHVSDAIAGRLEALLPAAGGAP